MKNISTALLLFLGCSCFAQSQRQIENQMAFAKFYGYVKYFYPGDDAAKIDWDKFAIYGSEKVDQCKDASALKDSLNAMAKTLMPGVKIIDNNEKVVFPSSLKPANLNGIKEITWQHLGIGLLKDKRSLYQSARTNRKTVFKNNFTGIGNLYSSFDAKDVKGKTFVFSGKAKLSKGKTKGQFWVRVDRENGEPGFFDNMDNRPITSKEWTNFEIKGTIDSDAKRIYFGAYLLDKGDFAVDDLSFKIEGYEIYKKDFEDEIIEAEPKSIGFGTGRSSVKDAKYLFAVKNEGQNKFVQLSSPLNLPGDEFVDIKPFSKHASFGEYVEKPIGKNLKIFVPLVLYGSKDHTFPVGDSTIVNSIISSINGIENQNLKVSNIFLRLGNLINTWNVFQHFYPYFDVAKTDWSADLKDALTTTYVKASDAEYLNNLQKFTAKLKDGHITVSSSGNMNYYLPPFAWKYIEGKWVITTVLDKLSGLEVGDVIAQVNGLDIKNYMAAVAQNISSATQGYLNHRLETESIYGTKDSKMQITVAGNSERITLSRNLYASKYYPQLPKQDTIKSLGKDITYINISNAKMKKIDESIELLKNSKAIICDLRGYPSDNTGLLEYLMVSDDTSSKWMQIPQIIYPDQEKTIGYQHERWALKAKSPHLNAKIFFLIDGQAISYAESYMSFVEHYKLATIIGQPTAGTNGNVNSINLPGGYSIRFTGMKVLKHDGSQHHGVGIIPNIYVEQTIKGITEGRDEILERAIAEASK